MSNLGPLETCDRWEGCTTLSQALRKEADDARDLWGPFRSAHEAYGVLAEEVMELLQAIHHNDIDHARREALQVAAVAFRFARDGICRDPR